MVESSTKGKSRQVFLMVLVRWYGLMETTTREISFRVSARAKEKE